jgi:hypothetical protein
VKVLREYFILGLVTLSGNMALQVEWKRREKILTSLKILF